MKIKVGIFDSGIGGFTILNSLLKSRKDVEVFYLADTKRNPYGNKNFNQIRSIAKEVCTWFEEQNLDALLVACNTTNACALDLLKDNLKIPCFDLINSVSGIVNQKIIGVLATPTTVKSCYYKKAIISQNKNTKIFQQECPEFVPEIEKNKLNFKKINFLSDLYLYPLLKENIQELILGCSHYPLIYSVLRNKLNPNINIIDPSLSLIKKFNEYFSILENYSCSNISYQDVRFFVTGNPEEFSQKVKYWLEINKEINLVNLRSID